MAFEWNDGYGPYGMGISLHLPVKIYASVS